MGNFDCDEIHEIRLEHSEKIKKLTPEQIIEKSKNDISDILKEYKEICSRKKIKSEAA